MTTVDCLVDLTDKITKTVDELSKLDVYGIRVIENQWFTPYLTKRKQKVFVNGVESD